MNANIVVWHQACTTFEAEDDNHAVEIYKGFKTIFSGITELKHPILEEEKGAVLIDRVLIEPASHNLIHCSE